MWTFFIVILLSFVSFIPIVFWWYMFSYFDNNSFNRTRFFLWILAWWISVIPILYLWEIIEKTNFFYLNIFYYVSSINSIYDIVFIFFSFFFLLFFVSIIPFLIFINITNYKWKIKLFFKNIIIYFPFLCFIWFLIFFLNLIFTKLPYIDFNFSWNVTFWSIEFNTFKLVIFYYIIVSIIEELSKFFSFDYSKNNVFSKKKSVIYAIFIALWFSFLENILYLKTLYEQFWLSGELLKTYFYRNIFSVVLHIFATSVFVYFSASAYLRFDKFNFKFLGVLFIWFISSILLHSFFNISLTFWLTFFIIFYLIWAYFYLTYILQEEN